MISPLDMCDYRKVRGQLAGRSRGRELLSKSAMIMSDDCDMNLFGIQVEREESAGCTMQNESPVRSKAEQAPSLRPSQKNEKPQSKSIPGSPNWGGAQGSG